MIHVNSDLPDKNEVAFGTDSATYLIIEQPLHSALLSSPGVKVHLLHLFLLINILPRFLCLLCADLLHYVSSP